MLIIAVNLLGNLTLYSVCMRHMVKGPAKGTQSPPITLLSFPKPNFTVE